MDEKKVQELLKKLDDPNVSPIVKDTIRDGLERALQGGFKEAYHAQLQLRARTDLNAFSEYVFGHRPMPHHREITNVLQDDSKKEVLIVAPPGSAKSTYTSQIFPPWYIGRNPEHASILLSSSSSQSIKFSTDIRSVVVANEKYREVFPEIEIDPLKGESREQIYVKREFQYPHPNLYAAGMKSSKVLGSRAHLIVVDDPTTEILARSELELSNQKDWFESTLMTRLIPDTGRIVVILTRWHNNDLASMLMNKLNFDVIHMPALGDERGAYVDFMPPLVTKENLAAMVSSDEIVALNYDDPMTGLPKDLLDDYNGRLELMYEEEKAKGTDVDITFSHPNRRPAMRKRIREDNNPSIWPEYFKDDMLKALRINRGSVKFNLLYQGDPTALEGDIFRRNWFQYYGVSLDPNGNETTKKKIPDDATYFMSVDPAISQKASADYFVVAVMARDKEGNLYVVHVLRTKLEAPDQKKAIKKLYQKYPQTVWVLVETIAYQQSLFQELLRDGVPCRQYKPTAGKDKEMRARSASVFYEAGKVYHPTSAPWLSDFEDELTSFPRAAKDDQVDAVSSLLEEISLLSSLRPVTYKIGFG
jgi:predicted phage terminase large subunit-like protein